MLLPDIFLSSITQGAVYVISALGIVLIYKTTRVMNFAHGYMAALGGYISYEVVTQHGQSFVIGVVVALVIGAALGFLIDALVMGPLAGRSHLELVIVTIGINYIIQAFVEGFWGYDERAVATPFGDTSVSILGVKLGLYNIVLAVCGILAVLTLTMLLRYTSWGLRLRATFDDPVAARLTGMSVRRVRSVAWTAGGALAGVSGALLAPIIYLSPERLPLILILSFCGAVIGGLTSLPGTIIGGVGAALTFQFGSAYISNKAASVLLYAAIIVLLWLRPNGIFGDGSDNVEARSEGERDLTLVRWLANRFRGGAGAAGRGAAYSRLGLHLAVGLIILFVLPTVMGPENITLGTFIATFIAVLGLSVGLAYAGQISFGQVAFMMLGIYTAANVIGSDPSKWWLGLLAGTGLSFVTAVLIGLPTVRLRGAYFAIVTLALALAATEIAFNWTGVTGGYSGIPIIRPAWLNGSTWYALIAGVALVCYYGLVLFRSSNLGRRLVAARDDVDGAETMGISVFRWRLVTFVITGTLGGLAGAIYGLNVGYVGAATLDFHFSLLLFVASVVARSITTSIGGVALIVFVPLWLTGSPSLAHIVFGCVLIATMFVLPKDLTHLDVIQRFRTRRNPDPPPAASASADDEVSHAVR